MSTRLWLVGAQHQAFGPEGVREYLGTERGARILAGKIARKGGHGWRPLVSEQNSAAIETWGIE